MKFVLLCFFNKLCYYLMFVVLHVHQYTVGILEVFESFLSS